MGDSDRTGQAGGDLLRFDGFGGDTARPRDHLKIVAELTNDMGNLIAG